ncbi:NAD(P)/FAD-dependent oxidoreductase [Mycolicibacterium moriokaense]|nr:NAD(P)/FAD-dependent oxidoreductase [Mycolicibacterium moriokaense]
MTSNGSPDVLVCGAGAAGLAAAATLGRAGVSVTILERTDGVGASWRSRYDALRLNTPGWMSTLPGYRASRRRYGEYPTRDDWVRYLEDYAAHHRIRVRSRTPVCKVLPTNAGWQVETDRDTLHARFVVVATGYDREPNLPAWPGSERFPGSLIHSSAYRNPDPYRDRDVLVVGPNTTGTEVANDLAKGGAKRVRMACRTVPNLIARKFLGVSVNIPGIALNRVPNKAADQVTWLIQRMMFGDLGPYGLARSPLGVATNLAQRQQAPAYDNGFVAELKGGRIEIVPAVVGFDDGAVVLDDGSRLRPDAIIAATGYRRGLEGLVGHLGVLDGKGLPKVCGGEQHPSAPGLFFNGYRVDLSGQLRLMRFGARQIATEVRRALD